MKKNYLFLVIAALGCGSNDTQPTTPINNSISTSGGFSGTINGTEMNTSKSNSDNDEHGFMINRQNNFATFSFLGEESGRPRRGFITVFVDDFKFSIGSVSQAYASMQTYKDAAGNEDAQYTSKLSDGYTNFTITDIDSSGTYPNTLFEISGTLTTKMNLKVGYENDRKSIEITTGIYTKIKGLWL